MRISDWSSDVCSSDLVSQGLVKGAPSPQGVDRDDIQERISMRQAGMPVVEPTRDPFLHIKNPKVREETKGRMMENSAKTLDKSQPEVDKARNKIGRASCRERVCKSDEIQVARE